MATKFNGSEAERAALDVFIKLNRAADSLGARLACSFAGEEITGSQFGVLDALHFLGPLKLSQLARKHLRSPNNMTSVVAGMERCGLVTRQRQDSDRRVVLVSLTDKGTCLFTRLWPKHLEAILSATSVLSPEEQQTLGALLKKLGTGAR